MITQIYIHTHIHDKHAHAHCGQNMWPFWCGRFVVAVLDCGRYDWQSFVQGTYFVLGTYLELRSAWLQVNSSPWSSRRLGRLVNSSPNRKSNWSTRRQMSSHWNCMICVFGNKCLMPAVWCDMLQFLECECGLAMISTLYQSAISN